MEDLPIEYNPEHFNITCYNPTESEACRKRSMQIGIDNYKSQSSLSTKIQVGH